MSPKFETDGNLRAIKEEDLTEGTVLRWVHSNEPTLPPFGDVVVCGVNDMQVRGDITTKMVLLKRPYMRKECGVWVAGVEAFQVTVDSLIHETVPWAEGAGYKVILDSRGEPYRQTV